MVFKIIEKVYVFTNSDILHCSPHLLSILTIEGLKLVAKADLQSTAECLTGDVGRSRTREAQSDAVWLVQVIPLLPQQLLCPLSSQVDDVALPRARAAHHLVQQRCGAGTVLTSALARAYNLQ